MVQHLNRMTAIGFPTRARRPGLLIRLLSYWGGPVVIGSVLVAGTVAGTIYVATNPPSGPPPGLQSCSSVTYPAPSGAAQNITYTFDREYGCEQFANGDWFVIPDSPGGTVTITSMAPATTGSGTTFRNGMVSNIAQTTGNTQSFDGRVPGFTAAANLTLPYVAHGGESLLKLVSNDAPECTGSSPDNCARFAAVLTVLDTAPADPEHTFRPPYAWSYKPQFTTGQLRTDLLLNLDSTPVSGKFTRQQILDRVLHQRYATYPSAVAVLEAEDAYPPDGDSWGGDVLKKDTEIINWLMLDDACASPPCSAQQELDAKLPILIGYVQYGIDMWGAFRGGTDALEGGGGNGAGRLFISAFAATMLDNSEMKTGLAASNLRGWWETYSYWRSSKTGVALWGQMPNANWSFSTWEQNWWNDFPACSNCNLRDPYEYIDGGSIPGTSYMRSTMMPTKYMALVFRMIPEVEEALPPDYWEIITEYADRVVASGALTIPDPCRTETGVYGVDHGPNGSGNCIFNPADDGNIPPDNQGRVPSQNGDTTDGEGASRHSAFNDDFWVEYRGDF